MPPLIAKALGGAAATPRAHPEGFSRPTLEYVVLDVDHYPVEELRPVEDVVSGVFLMEQAADLSGLREVVEEMQALIDDPKLEQDIALLMSSVMG